MTEIAQENSYLGLDALLHAYDIPGISLLRMYTDAMALAEWEKQKWAKQMGVNDGHNLITDIHIQNYEQGLVTLG